MLRYPFEKISIKMIVDGADIHRPSFYNHFLDKYDLLEWIVAEEVIRPTREALNKGQTDEAWLILFTNILRDDAFYRKAYTVTGQNGFEEAFIRQLQPLIAAFWSLRSKPLKPPPPLQEQDVSLYYSLCLSAGIKAWLLSGRQASAQELLGAARFLTLNSPSTSPGMAEPDQ